MMLYANYIPIIMHFIDIHAKKIYVCTAKLNMNLMILVDLIQFRNSFESTHKLEEKIKIIKEKINNLEEIKIK